MKFGKDPRHQANSEVNPSPRFAATHVHSILLNESCSTFFQGCCELSVSLVSFEKRFDARLERLVIYVADRMSGSHTGGGRHALVNFPTAAMPFWSSDSISRMSRSAARMSGSIS